MVDDTIDQAASGEMTLIEHLTELRTRILKSLAAVVVGAVVCLIFNNQIIDALIQPYCDALPGLNNSRLTTPEDCALFQRSPTEGFSLLFSIAAYGGLALAMPVVLWQLWKFIVPGLYPHEKRYAVPFVVSGVALFFLGAGLAYWSIPRALNFLLNIGGDRIEELLAPADYISFVIKMLVAFGVGFQFPLVLVFLQMIGLVHYETLKGGRRYAIVGIVVLVAILTPSGDPGTLIVLSVPMYVFYEAAIVFGKLQSRRQRKKAGAAA